MRTTRAVSMLTVALGLAAACKGSNANPGDAGITPGFNDPLTGEHTVCGDEPCSSMSSCVDCTGGGASLSCTSLGVCEAACTAGAAGGCGSGRTCVLATGAYAEEDAGAGEASCLRTCGTVDAGVCPSGTSCVSVGGGESACVPTSATVSTCASFTLGTTCNTTTPTAVCTVGPAPSSAYCDGDYCATGESCDSNTCECAGTRYCCDGEVCPESTSTACATYCASHDGTSYEYENVYAICVPTGQTPTPVGPGCTGDPSGTSGTCVCVDGRQLPSTCTETRTCESRCETTEGVDAGVPSGDGGDASSSSCPVEARSLSLDGTAYVDFGQLGAFSTEGTIEVWFQITATSSTSELFATATALPGSTGGLIAYLSSSSISALVESAPPSRTAQLPAFGVTSTVWHHLALTWSESSGSAVLYYDGAQASSVAVTSFPTSFADFALGGGYTGVAKWVGLFDELRVSSVVRYASTFTPTTTPFTADATTLGLWHFDDAAGATTFADASGNGHPGTLETTGSTTSALVGVCP